MTKRQEILEQSIREVCMIKSDSYGKPEDSFSIIAEFWTTYINKSPDIVKSGLKIKINPDDVAIMMILLKIAREIAACAAKIAHNSKEACAAEVSLTK